jgi:hypothetical protein
MRQACVTYVIYSFLRNINFDLSVVYPFTSYREICWAFAGHLSCIKRNVVSTVVGKVKGKLGVISYQSYSTLKLPHTHTHTHARAQHMLPKVYRSLHKSH